MHPQKVYWLIEFIDDKISTWLNALHSKKALFPIDTTNWGIIICFKDEHSQKAYSEIDVTDIGISIWHNDEHL